ncbi:MAG: mevalonate kinase [Pseudomonadota bacterium]|jgi:mevalonate kinase
MTQVDFGAKSTNSKSLMTSKKLLPTVQASASGKAIIVGEHAVVYGARAVAMPIPNLKMAVSLTPSDKIDRNGRPQIRMLIGGRQATSHLQGVVQDAFHVLSLEPFAIDLEGHSTVMVGAGLGSSASLCIVVLKAIAAAAGKALTTAELANFGNQLERRFHGNPSGLDTAAVALEQAIAFRKGLAPEVLQVAAPKGASEWRFALIDSGIRSSTLSMIQVAAPYFQGSQGEGRIAAFDQISQQVIDGLNTGNQSLVATGMDEAGRRLAEAGVVSEPLRQLIDQTLSVGCLAAKTTGAGGGGCILALLDQEQSQSQLAKLKERLSGTYVCSVELP